MDAVKFLKEFGRMCSKHIGCKDCPLKEGKNLCLYNGYYSGKMSQEELERAVEIVENWCKEYPEKLGKKYIVELDKAACSNLSYRIKGTGCWLNMAELERLEEYAESEE